MQVVLVMLKPDGDRRSFSLARDMTVIGRREDCDLRIPLADVSRKHCRVVKEAGGIRIEDLGSSNGTFRNGERIQEAMLEAGDQIRVGPVAFIVQIDGVPSDDQIAAGPAESAVAAPDEAPAPEPLKDPEPGKPGEFDPMSALLGDGGDSGVNLDLGGSLGGSVGGDSARSDQSDDEKV